MSRRTVLSPTTLLAVVVLALAMVGAYASLPHESGPAVRIATVTHDATATTLDTTAAAADGFDIEMFVCAANRTVGGPGSISCSARWIGGNAPFNPVFFPSPGGTSPRLAIFPPRSATFTFGCLRSLEYTVTFSVSDVDGNQTPTQRRKVPCGNS